MHTPEVTTMNVLQSSPLRYHVHSTAKVIAKFLQLSAGMSLIGGGAGLSLPVATNALTVLPRLQQGPIVWLLSGIGLFGAGVLLLYSCWTGRAAWRDE